MRGEVRQWLDVPARAALARTCRALQAETPVPALPPEWRTRVWDVARAHPDMQRVLIELVTFGVPQWLGAFRYTTVGCDGSNRFMWQWHQKEDDMAVGLYWCSSRADVEPWTLHWWFAKRPEDVRCRRRRALVDLPLEWRQEWQAFVASPRPKPADPWAADYYIDRD
jgi:hypothetical protein